MSVEFTHLVEAHIHELIEKSFGPVKWCNRCSRRHPARGCQLVTVERISKAGNTVTRLAHDYGK